MDLFITSVSKSSLHGRCIKTSSNHCSQVLYTRHGRELWLTRGGTTGQWFNLGRALRRCCRGGKEVKRAKTLWGWTWTGISEHWYRAAAKLGLNVLVWWGWVKGSQTGSLSDLLGVCFSWLENLTIWFYDCLDHKVEVAMNSESKVKMMMMMMSGSLILKHFLWKGEAAPLNPYLAPVIRNKNRVTAQYVALQKTFVALNVLDEAPCIAIQRISKSKCLRGPTILQYYQGSCSANRK